jgi:hypothetical protein
MTETTRWCPWDGKPVSRQTYMGRARRWCSDECRAEGHGEARRLRTLIRDTEYELVKLTHQSMVYDREGRLERLRAELADYRERESFLRGAA